MKKLFLVISAFALVFSSCSSSDSSPVTSSNLVTKIISTSGGISSTRNYNYIGNKITNYTSSTGDSGTMTYTGDLITKIEYFTSTSVLSQRELYSYNSDNKLISYLEILYHSSPYGTRTDFIYNADGTISFTKYFGNDISQTSLGNSGKAFFTNGEITTIEEYLTNPTYTKTTNYSYDNKFFPFQNVTGFSKIAFTGSDLSGFVHNIISKNSNDGTILNSNTYSYTYNTLDYPISQNSSNSITFNASGSTNTETITFQYFY